MFLESIRMSWENIAHNKLRSFLTMLGIVIGVASIIALITIVQGATNSISSEISSLGVNKVMVSVTGTPLKQGLSDTDLKDIMAVENVGGVSPAVSVKTSVVAGGR
jgi:putative ABC transport system permease protein